LSQIAASQIARRLYDSGSVRKRKERKVVHVMHYRAKSYVDSG
jgi:hypothetical protein